MKTLKYGLVGLLCLTIFSCVFGYTFTSETNTSYGSDKDIQIRVIDSKTHRIIARSGLLYFGYKNICACEKEQKAYSAEKNKNGEVVLTIDPYDFYIRLSDSKNIIENYRKLRNWIGRTEREKKISICKEITEIQQNDGSLDHVTLVFKHADTVCSTENTKKEEMRKEGKHITYSSVTSRKIICYI